ncbi:MAG TPA: SUMF1/EgtB/PvdO family nonheme iron enzyme [Polyangia bacterium]|nr:SUMF1/EgtB/PvdO family nonheme iron enzyme [Polyangia bacterium]
MGEPTDERTDQFSFCVALYEALYGQRPFDGDTLVALSVSVTNGHLRALPKERDVPGWIRRVVLRGLQTDRQARHPSMAALISALEDDPAVARRRRTTIGAVTLVLVGATLAVLHAARRRHEDVERSVAEQIERGNSEAQSTAKKVDDLKAMRTRAFAAFDAMDRDEGEALWKAARAMVPPILGSFDAATQAFEAALVLDPSREIARSRLLEVLADKLALTQDLHLTDEIKTASAKLVSTDAGGTWKQRLSEPFTVGLHVSPPSTTLSLERHYRDQAAPRGLWAPVPGFAPPTTTLNLEAGSYRVVARATGFADLIVPFELRRGDPAHQTVDVVLPTARIVPEGMVYVPAGESWFGDADEQLRTEFLGTVPIHRRHVPAFLIARTETTYREWIAFLEALPPNDRGRHLPDGAATTHGSVTLRQVGDGWQFSLGTASHRYAVRSGQPFVYVGRQRLAKQNWLQFPVAGVSLADVEEYLAWLRSSGRVPGARLCDEVEWERAARGADDRLFPNGDEIAPDDANFDISYGRVESAYGPDAVGSHPGSRSPFGIDDLAGNVLEFAVSSQTRGEFVIRGGAYYFNSVSARSTNREPVTRTLRDSTTGVRVCATAGEEK